MSKYLFSLLLCALASPAWAACPDYLQQSLKKLRSNETVNLCERFGNKPLLVVNTASHCGFTPQFKGLEALHQQYKDRGLEVIGFPSDDFFQESNDESETASVCFKNYGVSFSMFSPVHVRGDKANPVFKALAEQSSAPIWNFTKYVVDRNGKLVGRFGSKVEPDSADLKAAIEKALQP